MTAPTPIARPAQPTLPGLEGYQVTRRLVGMAGSFELATEFDVDAAFHAWLEGRFGQEVTAYMVWANEDGETSSAALTFTVGGVSNTYHEDAEGEAGRVKKIVLRASELGFGEA